MREIKKINLAKYDFIYKVNNFDYFLFSLFFDSEYCKHDFIFTNENDEWKAYLSKKDREKTSLYGLKLLQNDRYFNKYNRDVSRIIKKTKKFFESITKEKFSNFSNNDLANQFAQMSKLVTKLWSIYLPTEYFYYDEVERRIMKKIGAKSYLKKLFMNVKRMQKIKYRLRIEINKTAFGDHIFSRILKEISRRTGVKNEWLHQLDYREIIDLINGKKIRKIDRNEYIIGQFSKWNLINGKGAKTFIKALEKYHAEEIKDVLVGQIGNKGKYVGRVKIINLDLKLDHIKEISKMKKGDVLVSGSTGPEMILACQKAGAIVTEEGGITSHAAIVSRELGIPAVIGTKIATQVLKDGDLVEVDADRGMVKIIKK